MDYQYTKESNHENKLMHNHNSSDFSHPKDSQKETSTGRWTAEEHQLFLEGLRIHRKQWKQIADLIKTRTVVQIRTHAQKYFQKLSKSSLKPEDMFDDASGDSDSKSVCDDLEDRKLKSPRYRHNDNISNSPKSKRQKSLNNTAKPVNSLYGSLSLVDSSDNDWFLEGINTASSDYDLDNIEDIDFLRLANTVSQSILQPNDCQCSQLCKHISLNNNLTNSVGDSPRQRDNSIATTNESSDDMSIYDQPFKYTLQGAMNSIDSDLSRYDTEDDDSYEIKTKLSRKRGRTQNEINDSNLTFSHASCKLSSTESWDDDDTFGGFLEIFA